VSDSLRATAGQRVRERGRAGRWDPVATVARGTFRADIQGLRAIAVLLVLAYHLWPTSVPGGFVGVDVFFVISGFLITAHLLEHPPRGGRDLLEFWGRRIRRLLPAAFLVLAVTAVASRIVAPETQWATIAGQTIASALYVQNWVLAGNAVDYLASAEPPTPVQHYWSLSVEEQFYVVWPIVILAVFWLASRRGLRGVSLARLAMLAIVGISLAFSITATDADPASAYFITPTRVWELAAGGFVATLPSLAGRRLGEALVAAAAWLGLAMLLAAGFLINADTPFPGSAALLPVAGTVLVILAASIGRTSPTRLLGLRPIQHLGDTSYSIYLWHWPLIILWQDAFGEISTVGAIGIVALTIGLATLSKVQVEDRFRFAPSFQPLVPTFRFAAVGMVVLTLIGGGQLLEAQLRVDAAIAAGPDVSSLAGASEDEPSAGPAGLPSTAPEASRSPVASAVAPTASAALTSCVGAAAIVRGFAACPQDPAAKMIPDPVVAATDRSDTYRDQCWNYAPFGTHIECRYGTGPIRIALVGNSHAGHWLPALQVLAKRHGWTITTLLASQCNATDAPLQFFSAAKTAGCLAYGDWVINQTSGKAFDLVITSERQSVRTQGDTWSTTNTTAVAGYTTYLKRWSDAGTQVLVLEDTPYPGKTLASVPDCLALHTTNELACAGTPSSWSWIDPLYAAATTTGLPGITTLATTPFFCTDTICPAVIGSVVTYFDASHMTATYGRSLAPFIDPTILAALNRSSST